MNDAVNTREKILKKIRKALISPSSPDYLNIDWDSEIFSSSNESIEVEFAHNFRELGGDFVYCADLNELNENLNFLLNENDWIFCNEEKLLALFQLSKPTHSELFYDKINVAITTCECLIARTGSVMLSSAQSFGRILPYFSGVHIVIAWTSQLVKNTNHSFTYIKNKYNGKLPAAITCISGPSRTADIEQTLVRGVHGPGKLYCLLIEDNL